MKHLIAFALSACALLPLHAQDEATANGVVSIDDNRALTVRSNNGSFEFKPYLMVQTHGAFIGMTMKGWTRPTIKTMWPTPASPCLMPCSVSPARPTTK